MKARYLIGLGLLVAAMTGAVVGWLQTKNLQDHLDASAMVEVSDGSSGSCVYFRNGSTVFAWTDAHVVEGAEHITRGVDPHTGLERPYVNYDEVRLKKDSYSDGRKSGESSHSAKIIRYSKTHDLALLLLNDPSGVKQGVRFARWLPSEGRAIWHVGSMHGSMGENSVSEGCIAKVGRLRLSYRPDDFKGIIYDQVSLHSHKGCSGGGVFDKRTGDCLGLITEFMDYDRTYGLSYGAMFISPARRIREFAKRYSCEYAVDDSVGVPSQEQLLAGPIRVEPLPPPPPAAPKQGRTFTLPFMDSLFPELLPPPSK